MNNWSNYTCTYDFDGFFRLCIALRTNEFLGGNGYNKFVFGSSSDRGELVLCCEEDFLLVELH